MTIPILNLDASQGPEHGNTILYNSATKKWGPGATVGGPASPIDIIVGNPTGVDDHLIINAAIAQALTADAPARLIFAPGTYMCPSPLTPMTDSTGIEFVGGGGRHPTPSFRLGSRTEIRYTGTGAGRFIDATDANGFTITGLKVTYTSSSFTGTLIYAGGGANAPSYSPKFRDCFFGAYTHQVKTATIIDLDKVVECSIQDCAIVGGSIGINGSATSYSNAVTMTGGRFGDLDIAVKNPRFQWTFIGVAFEPGAVIRSVHQGVHGLAFSGCGWWDNDLPNFSWINISGSGLSISGGYWEPLRNDETLAKIAGTFDGVSITGLSGNGLGAATTSPLLSNYDGSTRITNLFLAGNGLKNCTDGIAAAQAMHSGSVAHTPARATHEYRDLGASGTAKTIPLASVVALTLDNNCTLTLPSSIQGGVEHRIRVIVRQDATGGQSITWPASVAWSGGTTPTLTATANKTDMIELTSTSGGVKWVGRVLVTNFDA